MNGKEIDGTKILVEFASNLKVYIIVPKGASKSSRGPQSHDKCFRCGRRGHWYILKEV